MGLNPGEGVVLAKTRAEVNAVNPICGVVGTTAKPRFGPAKSAEGLIPPKRKLVKKMMLECAIQAIASCFLCFITKTANSTETAHRRRKSFQPKRPVIQKSLNSQQDQLKKR